MIIRLNLIPLGVALPGPFATSVIIAAKSLEQLRENIGSTQGIVADARHGGLQRAAVMNQLTQRLSNDCKG